MERPPLYVYYVPLCREEFARFKPETAGLSARTGGAHVSAYNDGTDAKPNVVTFRGERLHDIIEYPMVRPSSKIPVDRVPLTDMHDTPEAVGAKHSGHGVETGASAGKFVNSDHLNS